MSATVFPASKVVHCPSGPAYVCDDHAEKLISIMGFMGYHVGVTEAHKCAMCSNCINESKLPQKSTGGAA